MPIYEFKCGKCGKQFEVMTMSMNEKANAACPKCKSKKVSKMMSSFAYGKNYSSSAGNYESAGSSGGGCSSCSSGSCSSCGH